MGRVAARSTKARAEGSRLGTFYVTCIVENHTDRSRSARVAKALVDTGSDYTWLPEAVLKRIGVACEKRDLTFTMANGQTITRSVGFVIIRIGDDFTIDEVVFAQEGDLSLLCARTLEGLNLRVDPKAKRLVPGGPLTAAAGTRAQDGT